MQARRSISRREFLHWSLLATAAGALAACAPKVQPAAPTQAPGETAAAAEPTAVPATAAPAMVELRYGEWPEMDGTSEAIAAFEDAHPNVKVVLEPHGDDFDQKLMAQCVAGTAPDILSLYGMFFFAFADKGQLLDLQPLVEQKMTEEDRNDFFKWHWPDGFVVPETGFLTAMPWKINNSALTFNKDAFDEAGVAYPTENWTYDDYAAALVKLTKRDAEGKVERWGGMMPAWEFDRFQYYLWAFGGHVVDPKDRTKCLLGEQPAQDALEWLRKRLWDDKTFAPNADWQGDKGWGGAFNTGECAIYDGCLSEVGYTIMPALDAMPDPFQWGVMHPPKGPAGRGALGSADGWSIYKNSKHVDEAWDFIYSLTQDPFIKANVIIWQMQIGPRKSQIKLFDELVTQPWKEKGVDMSVFTSALDMGYVRTAEAFIKQQESQVIIQEALDKVFVVGSDPVTVFADACEKVAEVHAQA